jgi:hypothetical protein
MRSPYLRPITLGLASGLFVISAGLTGIVLTAAPPASAAPSPSATPSTSSAPSITSTPSAASTRRASPTPPDTSTPQSTSVSPAASTPAPSATDRSRAPWSHASPSPSTTNSTPTPTPTGRPTSTPTPAGRPTTAPGQPRVIVSASATSVPPGGTISFRISAWSTAAADGNIATTLTLGAEGPAFSSPVFTAGSCQGNPASGNCELSLPGQQPATAQIEAQLSVPKTAPAGETITFSALVSVAGRHGAPLTATGSSPTVTVAQPAASPTPTPSATSRAGSAPRSSSGSTGSGSTASGSTRSGSTGTASAGSGSVGSGSSASDFNAVPGAIVPDLTFSDEPVAAGGLGVALPIGALPVVGSGGSAATKNVPAGNAASLFPEIKPSSAAPSAAPGSGRAQGSGVSSGQDAVATSTVLPISLTGSQFEAQIIALIILLLGITVVITGISVRKVRAAVRPSTGH